MTNPQLNVTMEPKNGGLMENITETMTNMLLSIQTETSTGIVMELFIETMINQRLNALAGAENGG